MNPRSLVLTLAVSVFPTLLAAQAQGPISHQITLPQGMSWCSDGMINGLFNEINGIRSQRGLPVLTISTLGMKQAEMRATQFATYMATANPTVPGFNPHEGWDTTAASLGYNAVSENLAFVTSDPAYIVRVVWQDPLHLSAMLAADANVAGVSCVYNNGSPYWTYEPGSCSGASCAATPAPSPAPAPAPTPAPTPSPSPAPGSNPTLDSEEWSFLTLINNYRAQNGLQPLQVSLALQNASRWMSSDMAAKNYLSHTDSLGRSSGARIAAFAYSYSPWGENIAAGLDTAQEAFNGWLNACDPDASGNCTYAHRRNMLSAGFAAIGIARAYGPGSAYGWYWTTDFGGVVEQAILPPGGSPGPSLPIPAVASFTATPSGINAGQTTTLAWSVSGAATVTIDNGIGSVIGSGSRSVAPTRTTTYTLTATNASGAATANVTVNVASAPAPGDRTPPNAPMLTSAAASSARQIAIAWTGSTDDTAVAGYQILRNGSVLTSVGAAALSYSDTSASPSTTYTYAVKSFDAAGNYSATSNTLSATTPTLPSQATCGAPAMNAFTGCYYNNTALSGAPVLSRTDPQVNFDWVYRPDPALPARAFSVRWQGDFTFSSGVYTFTATTSDGMRLYIDGAPVLDRWFDQPPSFHTTQQTISQGVHRITVEYYVNTGRPTAHLTWRTNSVVTQPPSILAFAANPSAITSGQATTLSWTVNGASNLSIDNGVGDVTGALVKSVQPAATTTYTLTASNAGGSTTARVTVAVVSAADTQSPAVPVLTSVVAKAATQVDLAWSAVTDNVGVAGYQILRNGSNMATVSGATLSYSDTSAAPNTTYSYAVKAYDAAGNSSGNSNSISVTTPVASSGGSTCGVPGVGTFTACYFSGVGMTGSPALTTTVPAINFDWGSGSPAPSVPAANFSARWQGYFDFDFAVYTFVATASDGIRVYLGERLLIDQWRDRPAGKDQASTWVPRGSHLVTVEYYTRTGSAAAHLTWQK